MTIEAIRILYDRAELNYAEAALYQEFEFEGENMILSFNDTILERGEEDDGEVIELERPLKLERVHVVEEPVKEAPECMNDVVKNVQEELTGVNLNDEGEERLVKISKGLLEVERRKLVALLEEYKDVL
nr:hypothetical protein CFP56_51911 [Quercus suber]